jgi:hypothetical protein
MGEPFDHCPAGGIRQSRECCTQIIHNPMVVHCRVSVKCKFANFVISASLSLNPDTCANFSQRVRGLASYRGWRPALTVEPLSLYGQGLAGEADGFRSIFP